MKIIIAGGRDFEDYRKLKNFIIRDVLSPKMETMPLQLGSREDIEIISGTANGADKLGEGFAQEFKLKCTRFPADWNRFGNSAGYRRNESMAVYANKEIGVDDISLLVAAWDGKSRGTKHMIDLALKHGLEVHILKY